MNTFAPSGLHFQTSEYIAKKLAELGFNCVRLNWSVELVLQNPIVHHQAIRALRDARIITDPRVRALTIMDRVIEDLAAQQIMVVLDNHMSDAGWCCDPRDENGLWLNDRYPYHMYTHAWEIMAHRYAHQPYVIAGDLRNEIRPELKIIGRFSWLSYPKLRLSLPTWGGGDREAWLKDVAPQLMDYTHPDLDFRHQMLLFVSKSVFSRTKVRLYDWHKAATEVGNRIIAANPNMLVIVQGLFDLDAYVPNVMQLIFFYLKHDPDLHRNIGRHFDIPDSVTKHYQMHNLTGIAQLPIVFDQPNRLVYSAHLYPFYYNGSQFAWDGSDPSYQEYRATVDRYWGYIHHSDIAPVWVGETANDAGPHGLVPSWTNYTLRYLRENDLSFAYWPIGDARPQINKVTGTFVVGYDDYALLNRNFTALQYPPMYESFKDLLEFRRHKPKWPFPLLQVQN